MTTILRKLRMEQSSGDARSSRDARGGQFHTPLPTSFRMNQSTIMLTILYSNIPTTKNSNEAYNNQWNQSTEPNAILWTIITNFICEESLSRKTLLDSASGANSTARTLANKNREINVLRLKT